MGKIALGLLVLVKIAVSIPITDIDNAYLGCFKDEKDRDLPYKAYESNENNTPNLCIGTCFEAGYMYAGLVYGHKCFCGNSYGRYGSVAETECKMECRGDRTQICGDYLRLSIYKTSLATTAAPTPTQAEENACGFTMSSAVSIPYARGTRTFGRVKMEVFYVDANYVPDYTAFLECCPNGPISVVADVSAFNCDSYLDTRSPDLSIAHGKPSKAANLCRTQEMTVQAPVWNVVTVRPLDENVPVTPWSIRFECAAE
ncbi:unnamed protein product [Owenia fusiformis]|uniref:Uncharacterized protein n=1 Tax=Owenia fusiformis TaxID=6347 RepID=A0A8J1YBM9_OWEFU|nr:unnamed protein product [Owenia fusiformis]